MKYPKCYMCENIGDTTEHVPPRSIFPEQRDIAWGNYRKNLITVPSCKIHNSGKSDDDQFLLICLAGAVGGNVISYGQQLTKIHRSLVRNSKLLIGQVLLGEISHVPITVDGRKSEIVIGRPNVERLNQCFDRIVRGLYFHEFKRKFYGKINMHYGFVAHSHPGRAEFSEFLKARVELDLAKITQKGENPEVFFYQINEPDENGLILMRLCFYEKLDVYAALLPEGAKFYNLAFDLMMRGIPTTLKMPDRDYHVDLSDAPLKKE